MLAPPEPIELPDQRAVFFPELVDGRGPPPPPASHSLLDLPDELRRHILARVPLADHLAAARVCRAFRDVIQDPNHVLVKGRRVPRFLASRLDCGFEERGILVVRSQGDLTICMAHKSGEMARVSGIFDLTASTTDGGSRLFFSTLHEGIWAVDASSRTWGRFATLPHVQNFHSLEWHNGSLYVAGGRGTDNSILNSFSAFNEATGSWDELPPMPHACASAVLGVIGNELLIAGGYNMQQGHLRTLQIYDIAGRTWRLGSALPQPRTQVFGVVADGKLFVIDRGGDDLLVYDPQSETWTEEAVVTDSYVISACAHNGRLVVFFSDGTACERANDGSWSPYEVARGCGHDDLAESVILG